MAYGEADIVQKIEQLNDVELAIALCLVNQEHCLFRAGEDRLAEFIRELDDACSSSFGLHVVHLDCAADTSLDDFVNQILVETEEVQSPKTSHLSTSFPSNRRGSRQPSTTAPVTPHISTEKPLSPGAQVKSRIAEVIIAKNLHLTDKEIQIQALELIRGRRIFTRTEVHVAPRRFLFCAVLPDDGEAALTPLLNDQIFMSHVVEDEEDENEADESFENTDDYELPTPARPPQPRRSRSSLSLLNVFDTNTSRRAGATHTIVTDEDIQELIARTAKIRMSAEIRAYLHNIIVFLRLHRAIAGGVTSKASRHFLDLSQSLAAFHGLSYVSPSIVALAARKVYPHRLELIKPEYERSLQWGSTVEAVTELLEGVTAEDVVEGVLEVVDTPL